MKRLVPERSFDKLSTYSIPNLFLYTLPIIHINTGVNGGIYIASFGLKNDTIIIIAKITGIAIALKV